MAEPDAADPIDIERAMTRLEEIIATLEKGGLGLRQSVVLFEEGHALAARCSLELDDLEKRLSVAINRPGANGKPGTTTEHSLGADDDVTESLKRRDGDA